MDDYKIIVEQEHQTVMAHYEVEERPAGGHQTEERLENSFIKQLMAQGYEWVAIDNEEALLLNLRCQLETLNDVVLSDNEWTRLLPMISNEQMTIQDKTEMLQGKGYILDLKLDNGQTKNIKLVDKGNIYNNRLQVINQYKEERGAHDNRYDVTILVNGLPMVHIELKKRGVSIKEAFNQINRYQRESFWAGRAMFDFVQIFVISNGTETKYYSNTTRYDKEKENDGGTRKHKTDGNTFEFTSYWTDQENTLLTDLRDFTTTFFAKHTILNILTKYCVFNVDKKLLVMRPYQIAATEKILQRIQTAINNRWQGTIKAGGYIWHTTGSGKTLTSFKTAQLASKMDQVKKVLFVVDRKDLDYQTMKEYDNFEPNCANSNSSSRVLLKQLKDEKSTIIITTIQKLSNLLKPKFWYEDEQLREVLTKENIVLIFDECHRSQFGDMHKLITQRVKRYMMFGFTGTPIFAVNASSSSRYATTAQLFGGEPDKDGKPTKALHTYTIINAIRDKNVLKFHVDYSTTMRMKSEVDRKQVWGIDKEEALQDPRRISIVTRYIIEHFAEKTKQQAEAYGMSRLVNIDEVIKKGRQADEKKERFMTRGFNSIFAVDSVKSAILYYNEFKKQLAEAGMPELRVATIYTYAANEEEAEDEWGMGGDENPENTGKLDVQSREALEAAIKDYNEMFGTSYSTDGDSFQNYYKDVSLRMKNKQIDILIVVGMFLTGFDAKTLNTLWVDKNLKLHGLLQAYSRTNRILNAVKNCGNIVCFRNLEKATDESLKIFGDENASGIVFLKSFEEYYETGYKDEKGNFHEPYVTLIERLLQTYPVSRIPSIVDEEEKKAFILLMGLILRLRNVLKAFDDFDQEAEKIDPMTYQDYLGWYNTLYEEYRKTTPKGEKESINDDLVFEMELVKQVQINISYILALVQKYHDSNCEDKEIIVSIKKQVKASPDMRDKRELIEKFIDAMTPEHGDVEEEWSQYIEREKKAELDAIIAEENLKPAETEAFVKRAFMDGYVTETGTGIAKILPPSNPFLPESGEKKQTVIEKLKLYLNKFLNTND
jgi:type I restriction enzyme R subunit